MNTTTFKKFNGTEEPAYIITKRHSRHRDFVIVKREGLKMMLNPALGVNDLRLLIWLCHSIEPSTDYIIPCSQHIIGKELGISQPAVSQALKNLFLLGILKKVERLENGQSLWIGANRFMTRKRNG